MTLPQIRLGLRRPETTLATLLRTEDIGLNDFLYRRKVLGQISPACTYGASNQTPKHILLFCPKYVDGRQKMLQRAGTSDLYTLLSTRRGLKAATSWFLSRGVLRQFSLAKEMAMEST